MSYRWDMFLQSTDDVLLTASELVIVDEKVGQLGLLSMMRDV